MKTFLLITTVMFTTPDKDFSGVIVEQFPSKIQCTIEPGHMWPRKVQKRIEHRRLNINIIYFRLIL